MQVIRGALWLCLSPLVRTPLRLVLTAVYALALFTAWNLIRSLFRDFHGFTTEQQRQLLQLHVVIKHGHRAPFRLYETDPNPRELWEEGLGALSKLGRLQMYVMGKHLRERYSELLTSNPNEVFAQSSDASRSLYSAYSFLAGFCPPEEEWAFTDVPWQPIEVHYVPESEEKYLQSNPNCPRYEASKKRTATSDEEVLAFVERYKWLYEFWQKHAQKKIGTYDGAGDLFKTLSVERDMNLSIPDWAFEYWDELVYQADVGYYFHFKTRLQQRLRAGPILGLILERMNDTTKGQPDKIKAYLYSGHGSNTAAIQCALQSYDMKHSPHATTIVQELYRENEGFYSTRVLLFNSSHPEKVLETPYALRLPGCPSTFCPLETYREIIRDLVPDDWKAECEQSDELPEEFVPIQYADMVSGRSKTDITKSNEWNVIFYLAVLVLFNIYL